MCHFRLYPGTPSIETLGRTQEGARVLQALKACRDAVNLPLEGKGKFLLIGIGRSPEVAALTADMVGYRFRLEH